MMYAMVVIPPEPIAGEPAVDYNETLAGSYLATYVRQRGFDCHVLDARFQELTIADTVPAILKYGPDVVGLTAPFATTLLSSIKIARGLRASGYDGIIVIGGHPATFSWQQILTRHPEIDVVVRGEGELTFAELLTAVRDRQPLSSVAGLGFREQGTVVGTSVRPLLDLDDIPIPVRDEITTAGRPIPVVAVDKGAPVFSIASSRGCPFNCSFCSVAAFYGSSPGAKWRSRSASSVVTEMESLANMTDNPMFVFIDDNFLGSCRRGKERAQTIARSLLNAPMRFNFRFETRVTDVDEDLFALLKTAGLDRVNLGIESLNPRTLSMYNKQITIADVDRALSVLRSLGIECHPNFILFEPDLTVEELTTILTTIRKLRLHWTPAAATILFSNQLALFAGTTITEQFQAQGRTRPWRYRGVSEEDNDILNGLEACFKGLHSDPRMEVLQSVHLRRANIRQDLTTMLMTHRFHLAQAVDNSSLAEHARSQCRVMLDNINSWLNGLGAVMLEVLMTEAEAAGAYKHNPRAAVPKLEQAWDALDQYDREYLGSSAEECLRRANLLAPSKT